MKKRTNPSKFKTRQLAYHNSPPKVEEQRLKGVPYIRRTQIGLGFIDDVINTPNPSKPRLTPGYHNRYA